MNKVSISDLLEAWTHDDKLHIANKCEPFVFVELSIEDWAQLRDFAALPWVFGADA